MNLRPAPPSRPPQDRAAQSRLLNLRAQLAELQHLPRAIRLVWTAAPGWTAAQGLLLAIQAGLPALQVYLTRLMINQLVDLTTGRANLPMLMPLAAAISLVLLVSAILSALGSQVQLVLAERTQDHMQGLIQSKAAALDLQFFETPQFHDRLQRAAMDAADRPLALLNGLSGMAQNSLTLAAMAGLLVGLAWWMPLVLAAGALPALVVALQATIRFHAWRHRTTIDQRRLLYFQRVLLLDQAAAELRLFSLSGFFQDAYRQVRTRLRDERIELGRKEVLGQAAAALAGLAGMAFSLGWAALRIADGALGLGELAMFYQVLSQSQQLSRSLLTGLSDVYRNLLFLEDLFSFLDQQPLLQDPDEPTPAPALTRAVEIRDVAFRYPGSERQALAGFNLELPAGQITAIVGENGAGKSTLIKLLCRFYDPDAGALTWDGLDLRQLSQASLHSRISVLFQQPQGYHLSARQNIALGDLAAGPDHGRLAAAAAAAGADTVIQKLPRGYDTLLGKWFGSADLSVGEWQRVALARAFLRQADLVILDEPTSAMDSWAELDFMQRFRQLVAGRTALIITHRFTTAMQADMIHVMAAGRVIESGTHAGLLALNGRYAESWRGQMRTAGTDPMASETPPGA